MIAANADRLGTPRLKIVAGEAPATLAGQPAPDAVFIGGGLGDPGVFEAAWEALKPGGIMVANVVTIEGELHLYDLHEKHGGDIVRIEVSNLTRIGRLARAPAAHGGDPLADAQAMVKPGTLYGVGVGPGDPELMTVKAWRLVSTAPVIAYLAANGKDSTARDIAGPFIPDDAVASRDRHAHAHRARARRDAPMIRARPRSPHICARAATWRCSARAIPSSMAASCMSSPGWRRISRLSWCRG